MRGPWSPLASSILWSRGTLALLLFADFLVIRVDDVVRGALRADDPFV